jgi:mono/diheme cytochrome c family protein
MGRRMVKILAVLGCIGMFLAVAAAEPKGSETKGKFFFKKNCKTCHAKGKKEASEVTPLTKTQAQWKAYFTAGKHAKGKEDLSKMLTPEQLVDVETFLVNHASDSPQPETCGG